MMMENLPESLIPIIEAAVVEEISVGNSRDHVYKIMREETFFLKVGQELRAEHNKLLWLEGRLNVPRVLHYEIKGGLHYLLCSTVEGEMAHEADLPPQRLVELLAEGARQWHSLPTEECPFDCTIDVQIDLARRNMERGFVKEEHFELHRQGRSVRELFADLLVNLPDREDLVVTHGDYCLPNVLLSGDNLSGFVDVGRMGVSDRYTDLALCARSIAWNIGQRWIWPFMEAYGLEMNAAKYNFYTLLDEYFN